MTIKQGINKLFFPHDNKSNHFKSLDGLRGLAVIFVLLSHTSNENIFIHEILNFKYIGKIGVYLFFVLSAYLLDRQIALAFLSNKSSNTYWKNYFLRRFLRIYPLFVISLLIHGLFTINGIPTVIDKLDDIAFHMLLLSGESIFWSIPVEFKYYFISPLIMWFCHKYLKWNILKLMLFFLLLIVITTVIEHTYNLPRVMTIKYLPIFIVGTIISVYEVLLKNKNIKKIPSYIYDIVGLISFCLILITIPFYFEKIFSYEIDFQSSAFYLPYAILWGLILISVKYGVSALRLIFEMKILRFIGTISFSIYLFHMLFIKIVKTIDIPHYLQFWVFLILTLFFSCISFVCIERPLSKIRVSSKKKKKKKPHLNRRRQ